MSFAGFRTAGLRALSATWKTNTIQEEARLCHGLRQG